MRRRTENDRNMHTWGRIFRDETGREGYGRDYGGRDGYGRDDEGRPGFNPPYPGRGSFGGGQQYGRDFTRRTQMRMQDPDAYGRDYGGWERHRYDFNGQEFYEGPPPMQFKGEDIYENQDVDLPRATGASAADRRRYEDREPLHVRMFEAARGELPERRRQQAERRARGRHTGRGPAAYKRPDTRIYEDVCDFLTEHHELDASDIEVKVERGEVTLEGLVKRKNAKRLAEDLAWMVRGVHDVHNRLRIAKELEGKQQDIPENKRADVLDRKGQIEGPLAGSRSSKSGGSASPGRAER